MNTRCRILLALLALPVLATQPEIAGSAETPAMENSGSRSVREEPVDARNDGKDNDIILVSPKVAEAAEAIEECRQGLAIVSYTDLARTLSAEASDKNSSVPASGRPDTGAAANPDSTAPQPETDVSPNDGADADSKSPGAGNDPAPGEETANAGFSIESQKARYEKYYSDCRLAFQSAVRNNHDEVIAALRESVNKSIEILKSNENRITTFYTLNRNGNRQYRALDLNSDIRTLIDQLTSLSGDGSRLPLYANWRSTAFTNQFYAGLDLNQVNDEASGNPRLGFITYFRTGRNLQKVRELVKTCTYENITCGYWGLAWPHFYLSTSFTSEAELTAEDESPESALDWEIGAFFPFYIARRGEDAAAMEEFMVGFLMTRGGRDIDHADGFLDRKYPGIRIAFNEEMYFDIMKGKSEGLSDRRWQFRGQFPVTEFGGGRLFFGISINFNSFSSRDHNDQESSSIYVTWQTSFDDLWAAGASSD